MGTDTKRPCTPCDKREKLNCFDVKELLHIDKNFGDSDENYYGFKIEPDGIWMLPPDHEYHRWNHDQRDFFEGFDIHTLTKKPVLAFPCTDSELKLFLQKSGLDGMVDPDALAGMRDSKHPQPESATAIDRQLDAGDQGAEVLENGTQKEFLDGEKEIRGFLDWSWNNCKKFMGEKGITGPPEGSKKWILQLDTARIIKKEHPPKRKK